MYFESSLDGFIFVHKKQKVHSVDAKKTIVKKVKNIVHLILTFKNKKILSFNLLTYFKILPIIFNIYGKNSEEDQ